ncbi:MAG TPA: glutathione S-transferase N-terminal domain-containing protein [Sphingobium sp.]
MAYEVAGIAPRPEPADNPAKAIWDREHICSPSIISAIPNRSGSSGTARSWSGSAYDRDPLTRAAPPAYKALHPAGTAPIISDGALTLAETGAIMNYIDHNMARVA